MAFLKEIALSGVLVLSLFCAGCVANDASDVQVQGAVPYVEHLQQVDENIAALSTRALEQSSSWLASQQVADAYLAKARLTGNYSAYSEAEKWLERSLAIDGAAPWSSRLSLNFSTHRLDRVDEDVERLLAYPMQDDRKQAYLLGMKGDIHFQRGSYDSAKVLFESALKTRQTVTELSRMAMYHWKTGGYDAAENMYNSALTQVVSGNPMVPAWLHLQLGLMDLDRGRLDDAMGHYQDAEGVLSGWWLIQEHMAEIHLLQGRLPEARAAYEALIAQTANPEFMDAMAETLEQMALDSEAEAFFNRATEAYESRLQNFPEATYGHALDHFIGAEGEGERALDMALKNYALRPGSPALIHLANAYLHQGDLASAQVHIEKALQMSAVSADLYVMAAQIMEEDGQIERAKLYREKALAINPLSFD